MVPKTTRQNDLLFMLSALHPAECYVMIYDDDTYCNKGEIYSYNKKPDYLFYG